MNRIDTALDPCVQLGLDLPDSEVHEIHNALPVEHRPAIDRACEVFAAMRRAVGNAATLTADLGELHEFAVDAARSDVRKLAGESPLSRYHRPALTGTGGPA